MKPRRTPLTIIVRATLEKQNHKSSSKSRPKIKREKVVVKPKTK